MAVPTLSAVSPATVFTAGQFVTITGTNFQIPYPLPDIAAPLPPPIPTVEVTFNGRLARKVTVLSDTQITCIAPAAAPGAATLVLKNLDPDGVPIAGEEVESSPTSLPVLVTYARADLSAAADLQRITRMFLQLLKQQVIENVVQTVSSDYTDEAGKLEFNITDIADLPCVAVTGPSMARNKFYGSTDNEPEQRGTDYVRRRYLRTNDLMFKVAAYDDSKLRILNIQALLTQVFELNTYFELQRDPADAEKGYVYFELDASDFNDISTPNNSDVRGVAGEVTIRGFTFEDVAGFPDSMVASKGTEVGTIEVATKAIPS